MLISSLAACVGDEHITASICIDSLITRYKTLATRLVCLQLSEGCERLFYEVYQQILLVMKHDALAPKFSYDITDWFDAVSESI